MELSARSKFAIKFALAICLAFYITLSMDWQRPYWAGLAIVSCSLTTTFGESINKGLLRLGGTFLGIFVALALISFFPQDRWLFVAAFCIWIGFCTYMMVGTPRYYFWMVSGFVVPVLVIGGGSNPVNDFDIVVLRGQQAVLGVLCYSVVFALLWASNSRALFEAAIRECLETQRSLIAASLARLNGKENGDVITELCFKAEEKRAALTTLLNAASLDSYTVWERRVEWKKFVADMMLLDQELQKLSVGLGDLVMRQKAPEVRYLREVLQEADERLSEVEQILESGSPEPGKTSDDRSLDEGEIRALAQFERAAFAVAAHHATQTLSLANRLKEEMCDLKDVARRSDLDPTPSGDPFGPVRHFFDRDTWISVLRVQVILISAVLCVFFIPGFPNPAIVISIVVSIALSMVRTPQLGIFVASPVIFSAIAVVGLLHIFVMPVLSTFWQLSLLLFAAAFVIAYLTFKPEQRTIRAVSMPMLVVGLQIQNEQHFSFLFYAILTLGLLMGLLVVELTRYFPVSLRSERRVEDLIKRFFASAEHVVRHSPDARSPTPGWYDRWLLSYHLTEIETIPRKLLPWLKAVPADARSDCSDEEIVRLAASLEAMSSRINNFVKARSLPQAASLVASGTEDMKRWRLAVADASSGIANDPGSADVADLEQRLEAGMAALEKTVQEMLNNPREDALDRKDYQNMYLILGTYRGLTEGVIGYARRAKMIDWPILRESRF